jgi:bacillithiol biosynthesis cysteine-adding enzyme BshC
MIEFPLQISIDELGGESKLFRDYVSGNETPIRDVLGGFDAGAGRWKQTLDGYDRSAQAGVETRQKLVDRLVDYNTALGVAGDIVDKLRAAKDGGVRFVVTGQQPGALGGPLLTLYKVATTIALAERIEREFETACVPLFWMGADDIDFQEISGLFLVDCNLTPLSTSISASAHAASAPVGDITADAVGQVWEAVEPIVSMCPHGAFTSEVVRGAIAGSVDHGEATARVITALTAGRAAVVDGREPAVRAHARDLFLGFFDKESRLREAVAEAGGSLERAGYHAQLWPGPDSGVFMLEDGRRRKISESQRQDTRDRMEEDVTRFSPGVVLRNLVQDYVFQPVAVVLGPAEIAYRAQLDGVYDEMRVQRPVVFPRMPATYLPPSVTRFLDTLEAPDVAGLLGDPAAFVKRVHASQRSPAIDEAAQRFRSAYRSSADEYLSSVGGTLDKKTKTKSRKRLADVERRLSQALDAAGEAGKEEALSKWPFLGGLGEFIRRRDKPQERYLSLLTPFLFSGRGAGDAVSGAASVFVDGALDGRTLHVVYSLAK